MNVQPTPADLIGVCFVYDGSPERRSPPFGNYLGCYGHPIRSYNTIWYWIAVNGDHGGAATAAQCRYELEEAWVVDV